MSFPQSKLSSDEIRLVFDRVARWQLQQVFSAPIHEDRWENVESIWSYTWETTATWRHESQVRVELEWDEENFTFLADASVCPSHQEGNTPEQELQLMVEKYNDIHDHLPTVISLPTRLTKHEVRNTWPCERIRFSARIGRSAPLSLAKEDVQYNILNNIDPASDRGKRLIQRICQDLLDLLCGYPLEHLAVYTENLIGPLPLYFSSWYGLTSDQVQRKRPPGETPMKYLSHRRWPRIDSLRMAYHHQELVALVSDGEE